VILVLMNLNHSFILSKCSNFEIGKWNGSVLDFQLTLDVRLKIIAFWVNHNHFLMTKGY
jgi:hypothetical protein